MTIEKTQSKNCYTMHLFQPAILAALPAAGRYVFFSIAGDADALRQSLRALQALADGDEIVVGIGPLLARALNAQVPGLREFPALQAPGDAPAARAPSTPTALCLWLRGQDRGVLVQRTRQISHALAPALVLDRVVDGMRHALGASGHGRDLTGYEDGTENPVEQAAETAAFARDQGSGLDGGSCWALQQWQHDFAAFDAMAPAQQDNAMGRRRSDNEELEDAPASAHVKRTAQESFEPEAFVLRRSMPWWSPSPSGADQAGLMFSAFGHSFDAFEAQMRRMLGLDDGIIDALYRFSRPLSGCYLWCPPMRDGRLDLQCLGIANDPGRPAQ